MFGSLHFRTLDFGILGFGDFRKMFPEFLILGFLDLLIVGFGIVCFFYTFGFYGFLDSSIFWCLDIWISRSSDSCLFAILLLLRFVEIEIWC